MHSVKRLIGRKFEEVAELATRLPYNIGPDSNGQAAIHVPGRGLVSPEQASAELLQVRSFSCTSWRLL